MARLPVALALLLTTAAFLAAPVRAEETGCEEETRRCWVCPGAAGPPSHACAYTPYPDPPEAWLDECQGTGTPGVETCLACAEGLGCAGPVPHPEEPDLPIERQVMWCSDPDPTYGTRQCAVGVCTRPLAEGCGGQIVHVLRMPPDCGSFVVKMRGNDTRWDADDLEDRRCSKGWVSHDCVTPASSCYAKACADEWQNFWKENDTIYELCGDAKLLCGPSASNVPDCRLKRCTWVSVNPASCRTDELT